MSELQKLLDDPRFRTSSPDVKEKTLGNYFDFKLRGTKGVDTLPAEQIQTIRQAFIEKAMPTGLFGGKEATLSAGRGADEPPETPKVPTTQLIKDSLKSLISAPVAIAQAPMAMAKEESDTMTRKGLIYEAEGNPRTKLQEAIEVPLRGLMLGGLIDRRDEPPSLKNTLLDILDVTSIAGGASALKGAKLTRAQNVVKNAMKVATNLPEEEAKLLGLVDDALKAKAAKPPPGPDIPPIGEKPPPGAKPPPPGGEPPPAASESGPGPDPGKFKIPETFDDPELTALFQSIREDPAVRARIIEAKRGVLSDDAVAGLAQNLDMTPDKLRALAPGTVLNAEGVHKAKSILGGVGNGYLSLVEKYREAQRVGNAAKLGSIVGDAQKLADPLVDILVKTNAVSSELGRAMRQLRVEMKGLSKQEQMLMKAAMQEPGMFSAEKAETLLKRLADADLNNPDAVVQFLTNEIKPSFVDKFIHVATAAKLTSPVTYLRNTVGNTLAVLTHAGEKVARPPVDFLRATLTGTGRERFIGEAGANLLGLRHGLSDAWKKALQTFADPAAASMGRAGEVGTGPVISGVKGKIVDLPFRMLASTDEFFKTILRRGELYSEALRTAAKEGKVGADRWKRMQELVEKPTGKMMRKADEAAAEFTFQSPLGKAGQFAEGLRNQFGGLPKLIVPFFKTPVNVGKFIVQRSPLAFVPYGRANQALRAGGAAATDAIARATMGTTLQGLLVWLAHEGYITGSGPDTSKKGERDLLQRSGWQPRSLKIGDKYYSYTGFDPLATALASAADIVDAYRTRKEVPSSETAMKMGMAISDNLKEQPFLMGVKDLLDAVEDPDRKGGRLIQNLAASTVVPAGVGLIQRQVDPVIRKPTGVVEAIKARVPGLSESVPARLNVFGEPITREVSFPISVTSTKDSPIDAELQRLKKSVDYTLGFRGNNIGGRKLEPREWDQLQRVAGQEIKSKLADLMQSERYQKLPDPARQRAIEKIERDTTEKVRDTLIVGVELRALGMPDITSVGLPEGLVKVLNQRLKSRIDSRAYKDKPDAERKAALKAKMRNVLEFYRREE